MKFRSKARSSSFCNQNVRMAGVRITSAGGHTFDDDFDHGFTLIELAVVISMILILLAIALPMYTRSVTHAREAKLRQNLATLNEVIEKYSLDKGHAPQTPDDLVQAGYIKFIPEDITGSAETWHWDQEDDPEKAWDPNQFGIKGVHSGSDETASDGSGTYSSW
jgi:general secretion pathway protein G